MAAEWWTPVDKNQISTLTVNTTATRFLVYHIDEAALKAELFSFSGTKSNSQILPISLQTHNESIKKICTLKHETINLEDYTLSLIGFNIQSQKDISLKIISFGKEKQSFPFASCGETNLLNLVKYLLFDIPANKIYKISGVPIPKNGHKGCVQSHLLALNLIKMNNWKRILILEDDAELNVNINDFNNQLNQINKYIDNNNWDVVMLATANATKTNINGEKNIVKLTNATTSSAYIINRNYVDKLVPLFNYANNMMVSEEWSEGSHERYALDQIWRDMQNKDIWLGFNIDLIQQRDIKSSINNKI